MPNQRKKPTKKQLAAMSAMHGAGIIDDGIKFVKKGVRAVGNAISSAKNMGLARKTNKFIKDNPLLDHAIGFIPGNQYARTAVNELEKHGFGKKRAAQYVVVKIPRSTKK